MAERPATLQFYFDFISSNAYLAWAELPRLRKAYGIEIEPVPTLFAGFLEAYGQLGPAEIPRKALWMARNNLRKANMLGLRLRPPAFHPFNPLLSLRVCSLSMPHLQRNQLIDALFRAVWSDGLHVSEPEVVARIIDNIGAPGREWVEAALSTETKQKLRQQTDDAIAHGAFGVPSMRVGDEIFWGYDDFPYLENFLAGKDTLDPEEWKLWVTRGHKSSAMRRAVRDRS